MPSAPTELGSTRGRSVRRRWRLRRQQTLGSTYQTEPYVRPLRDMTRQLAASVADGGGDAAARSTSSRCNSRRCRHRREL